MTRFVKRFAIAIFQEALVQVLDAAAMLLALASDGDTLNGRSTFLEPHSAAVTIQTLGRTVRRILEVAVATEDLEHLIGNQANRVDGEQLADCSLLVDELVVLVDVEVTSEVVNQGAQCMNHHLHVSNLHLDCLTLNDRLAEGYTISSALEGDLEHTLCHAQVRASDVYAGNAQGVDSNFHALTLFAEQVDRIELEVGELQTCMASTPAAHHVGHRDDFKARCVVGNEEFEI